MPLFSWSDQGAQGDQKNYRDKLIKGGMKPKDASAAEKKKFPLPGSQAKRKNKQPKGGAEPGQSRRGRGDDGSGRQTGAFGSSKGKWW